MKLNRRSFLTGAAASAALASLPLSARGGSSPKKLVIVFASGGWDVTYGPDPKLGVAGIDGPESEGESYSAAENVATWGENLSFAVNDITRPSVGLFFDRWAEQAAVINGIWVGSIAHSPCSIRMLTGGRTEASPDLGAITGYALGRKDKAVPYMDIGGTAYLGHLAAYSGRAGARNQLKTLLLPDQPLAAPEGSGLSYPLLSIEGAEQAMIDDFIAARADRILGSKRDPADTRQVADYFEAKQRSDALAIDGVEFAESLEYGRALSLTEQAKSAVSLLQSGLCQTVSIDSRQVWDTHDDNRDQHTAFEGLFSGLDVLMSELEATSLLSETVVVVLSEMTRTPKRNAEGGKDHWPQTSALVLGAGVAGGRTYGASDDLLNPSPVDLESGDVFSGGEAARYDQFAAGLLQLLDVDSGEWFPNTEAYRAFIS